LYFEPAQPDDPPLHLTLTFIENSTALERSEAWRAYLDFFAKRLPLEVAIGDVIKVGPNKDIDARSCQMSSSNMHYLERLYRLHTRRVNGAFPELMLHMTTGSEQKRAACVAFGPTAIATSIVLKTVGANKRTLRSLMQAEPELWAPGSRTRVVAAKKQ
jgi:hypothetical protein